MRTAIRRAADPLHLPRVPRTIEEFAELMANHQNITATMDGADSTYMALVGPPGHRSLIFMSRRVAAMLDHVVIVFSDGTFASRPSRPRFRQVFQISTSINNHVSNSILLLEMNSEVFESQTIWNSSLKGKYHTHFSYLNKAKRLSTHIYAEVNSYSEPTFRTV